MSRSCLCNDTLLLQFRQYTGCSETTSFHNYILLGQLNIILPHLGTGQEHHLVFSKTLAKALMDVWDGPLISQ